ncbi:Site-specific recombinase, phage integrase family, partial [human gut metagenome]
ETWVSSDNTLNRVRNYLDTYILPQFGQYQPDKVTSSDIQNWVNELATKSKESVDSGIILRSKERRVLAVTVVFTGFPVFISKPR